MVVAAAAAGLAASSHRRLERMRSSCHLRPRRATAQGSRLRLPLTTRAWPCNIHHISREGGCRLNNRHINTHRSPRHSFQRHLCLHTAASTNRGQRTTPSKCPSDQSPPRLRRRGRRKAMWLLHAYRASERISGENEPPSSIATTGRWELELTNIQMRWYVHLYIIPPMRRRGSGMPK